MTNQVGRCAIIGAGPAGLTAGLELARAGLTPVVFEMDDQVGGISRTVNYKGYRFDIGGHRFFTKVDRVHAWWMDILADEFLVRPRLSRIYYNGTFFDYPLKPVNALKSLGPWEAVRVGCSYIYAQAFPHRREDTLEQWVTNRFGRRLYRMFFKTYTEKVWGMRCDEIGADWAAQRIKDLDLRKAVFSMLAPKWAAKKQRITTLIEEFYYPKFGPGQMWERVSQMLAAQGLPVELERRVATIHMDAGRAVGVTVVDRHGIEQRMEADQVISSMPVKNLLNAMDPAPPAAPLEAANRLQYRDFLTVGLIVDARDVFPDNWIYIHSADVKVGRIQNFGNWSPHMVPDASKSCIGLEYFVQENDEHWTASDEQLIERAKAELATLGLVDPANVVDGTVIRMPKAYPVYDQGYKENVAIIQDYVARIPNLQLVGRNGQHRYNNQDHSMLTAIYAADNVLGADHDIWDVNVEASYHEQSAGGDRRVPQPVARSPADALKYAFAKYDPVALGAAAGLTCGLFVFAATAALLFQDGPALGSHLSRLAHFFPGYTMTWFGACLGFVWGLTGAYVVGFLTALVINVLISVHRDRLVKYLNMKDYPNA